jgi:hypothetical protein
MTESVIEATTDQFKSHPYLWGGLLIGIVAVVYFSSGKKTTAAPATFSYSYGPSDAAIAAGTALSIAQTNANAQVSMAASDTTAKTAIYSDYFGYLKNNLATQLTASENANATSVAINGQNVGGANYQAALKSTDTLAATAANEQIALGTAWDTYLGTVSNNSVTINGQNIASNLAQIKSASIERQNANIIGSNFYLGNSVNAGGLFPVA